MGGVCVALSFCTYVPGPDTYIGAQKEKKMEKGTMEFFITVKHQRNWFTLTIFFQ